MILICPAQVWFPFLMDMLLSKPLIISITITQEQLGRDTPGMAETKVNGIHFIRKRYVDLELSR